MPKLTRDSTVSKAPDLLDATVGRDVVLMSLARGSYYALDPVAAAIWEGIETSTTVDALCQSLTSRFDVSDEQCATHVLAFLEELRAAKLLRVAER